MLNSNNYKAFNTAIKDNIINYNNFRKKDIFKDQIKVYRESKKDILIQNGKIIEIGKIDKNENYDIIDCDKKIITQSFIDIHTHLKVPGIGDQETLSSGANAALAGGYSKICVMPDTNPITDNPELIKFILNESKNLPIESARYFPGRPRSSATSLSPSSALTAFFLSIFRPAISWLSVK